jgi:hypothetical protein
MKSSISVLLILIGVLLVILNLIFPTTRPVTEGVSVPYTESVPYQTTENKVEIIGTLQDKNLGGGSFSYWSSQIDSGKTVKITWSGDGYLYVYVLTPNQFDSFKLLGTTTWYTASEYGNSGTLTTTIQNRDTYYLAISNPWAFTTIKVYSAEAKLTWLETVTKYRDETRYRTEYITRNVNEYLILYSGLVLVAIGSITRIIESRRSSDSVSHVTSSVREVERIKALAT